MIKEFLKNNEENAISIVTIMIIIITLIVIIFTWIFNLGGSKNEEKLSSYNHINYEEEMKSRYSDEIVNLLMTKNTEKLYSKMNLNFLNDNNLNEENFRTYLLKHNLIGNSITIVSSNVIRAEDDIYIFRIFYKNYSDYKYANIIEERPGIYTISFEQEVANAIPEKITLYGSERNVKCELVLSEITNYAVRYNIRITNENQLDAKIDFNDINTFTLVGDDFSIPVAGVVAQNINAITHGSSINKELYFSISNEDYEKCNSLCINNILINGEYFDILIKLK